jgi:hypothetical protein
MPPRNTDSYINRKNFHSVLLQGVCDHRKLFIDVYARQAGSIHDYSMFALIATIPGLETNKLVFMTTITSLVIWLTNWKRLSWWDLKVIED